MNSPPSNPRPNRAVNPSLSPGGAGEGLEGEFWALQRKNDYKFNSTLRSSSNPQAPKMPKQSDVQRVAQCPQRRFLHRFT